MERFPRLIPLSAFLIISSSSLLLGAAPADRDLEGIKKKIANEKKGLSQLQLKEGSVLESLGKIQQELDQRTKELKAAQANLVKVAGELKMKESEARRLNESIAGRQEILQRRAAALYRWQRSGSPLIVLSGDVSLSTLLQRRRYLQTALSYDRELLAKLEEESRHQESVREELAEKKAELNEQKQALGAAQEAVRREAEKKRVLLASLRREKTTRLRVLKEMEAAAQRLEKMLEEISRRAVAKPKESPLPSPPGVGIQAMQGRLDWPVRGQLSAPFGKFKHPEFAAEVVRNGIDIEASIGEEIRVVEKGRVVYADRFSGYGRMVIVDHGDRYFTIYGHLSEISKKVGDEVRRGEVLGRVGDSDSLAGAKLYFEMRKDGRSVDPVPWLKN
jgi:septal ring factor EnvC (AmiA/AmiB activator)